ncbi:MAG TPA: hypothetical protein VK116_04485, partial [Planctomycetota bacterium]|nr:hypothetical protein [Planctomycetota bacterium]
MVRWSAAAACLFAGLFASGCDDDEATAAPLPDTQAAETATALALRGVGSLETLQGIQGLLDLGDGDTQEAEMKRATSVMSFASKTLRDLRAEGIATPCPVVTCEVGADSTTIRLLANNCVLVDTTSTTFINGSLTIVVPVASEALCDCILGDETACEDENASLNDLSEITLIFQNLESRVVSEGEVVQRFFANGRIEAN